MSILLTSRWPPDAGGWLLSVGCPLDLGKVDAFLRHLVQRAHLPQLGYLTDHVRLHEVDFRFAVEPSDAEADGGVRQILRNPAGAQDVARLKRSAGTRRPRG